MSNLGQKLLLLRFLNIAHLLRESDSVPSPHMKGKNMHFYLIDLNLISLRNLYASVPKYVMK